MTKEELRKEVVRLMEKGVYEGRTLTRCAAQIIDLCRDHFTAVPPGMEEWWIRVADDIDTFHPSGHRFRATSFASDNPDNFGEAHSGMGVIRILLPKPESERQKLVKELRKAYRALDDGDDGNEGILSLLKRSIAELEKVGD